MSILLDIYHKISSTERNLKSINWAIRRQAVWKTHDNSILLEIAKNDPHENVRAAAVEKISLKEENIFFDIIKNDSSSTVRYTAVSKINSENILIEIFTNENDTDICFEILGKIINKEFLEEVAKNHINDSIRNRANSKIIEIAQKDKQFSENINMYFEDNKEPNNDIEISESLLQLKIGHLDYEHSVNYGTQIETTKSYRTFIISVNRLQAGEEVINMPCMICGKELQLVVRSKSRTKLLRLGYFILTCIIVSFIIIVYSNSDSLIDNSAGFLLFIAFFSIFGALATLYYTFYNHVAKVKTEKHKVLD
jgi:hypothetical protein